jgi:hypothetical protein
MKKIKKKPRMDTFECEVDESMLGELLGHAMIMSVLELPHGVAWGQFTKARAKLRRVLKAMTSGHRRKA